MTLHRVVVPRRSNRAANLALDRRANFALVRWTSSRGECALGLGLDAGDVGFQKDYEVGNWRWWSPPRTL